MSWPDLSRRQTVQAARTTLHAWSSHVRRGSKSRRDQSGDKVRTAPLLEAALWQLHELGMTGWIRRAEELRREGA